MVAVQKKMDVIYQSQSDTFFFERVELFEGNMMKAYALIYGVYCSYDMKSKVDDAVAIDGVDPGLGTASPKIHRIQYPVITGPPQALQPLVVDS
jgi:hypothetical protein